MGAALLARFTSFPIAAGTGFVMGVIQSELIYLQTKSWFPTAGRRVAARASPTSCTS